MDISHLSDDNQMMIRVINKAFKTVVPVKSCRMTIKAISVSEGIVDDKDGNPRSKTFVNFDAFTAYNMQLVAKELMSKPLDEFTFDELNDLAKKRITWSNWTENLGSTVLPAKGETVDCEIQEHTILNGDNKGQVIPVVASFKELAREKAKSFDLADLLSGKANVSDSEELSEAEKIADENIG